jgi:rare lipoprotein A (peptidoglycan hydrolase)
MQHRPRGAAVASLALTGAAVGLLLAASGSQAISRGAADRQVSATAHPGYHRGLASWYNDDHVKTACGFHAKFGVANRTLKCGTKVVFLRNGYHATAVVDDRGPYVHGRTWDLDEHTASALHAKSDGVVTVWAKW